MEEIATVYARALFEVAEDRDLIDQIHDELTQFADALSENRQLAVFFFSPYFSTEEKKDGLKKAVTGADPAFMNFLEALIERHRMPAIFRIKAQYQDMWEDARDLLPVELTSAIELDSATVNEHRRAGRGADQAHGRAQEHGRPGHSRRDRAAGGQRDSRRINPKPTGTTSKASRAGLATLARQGVMNADQA